ncbi:MAG: hypothetical protein AVDCRST_MAG28-209, partial [uncultured Rubrobacteraceae bacterium]
VASYKGLYLLPLRFGRTPRSRAGPPGRLRLRPVRHLHVTAPGKSRL